MIYEQVIDLKHSIRDGCDLVGAHGNVIGRSKCCPVSGLGVAKKPAAEKPAAFPLVVTGVVAAFFGFLIASAVTQVWGEEKTRRKRYGSDVGLKYK